MQTENAVKSLMTPINRVIPHLYIGNLRAAEEVDILTQHDIKKILQCTYTPVKDRYSDWIEYMSIDLADGDDDLLRYIPSTNCFIHNSIQSSQNILVHCAAGVSRSASVVIAYLMASRGESFNLSLHYLRSQRPCVDPNEFFSSQLQSLETLSYYSSLDP